MYICTEKYKEEDPVVTQRAKNREKHKAVLILSPHFHSVSWSLVTRASLAPLFPFDSNPLFYLITHVHTYTCIYTHAKRVYSQQALLKEPESLTPSCWCSLFCLLTVFKLLGKADFYLYTIRCTLNCASAEDGPSSLCNYLATKRKCCKWSSLPSGFCSIQSTGVGDFSKQTTYWWCRVFEFFWVNNFHLNYFVFV